MAISVTNQSAGVLPNWKQFYEQSPVWELQDVIVLHDHSTKTSLTNLCMWVFWAELVVGSDDGGGGGPDHHGLGGGAGQVLQVAEAEEEDKWVEGEENEHSTAAKEAWHEWDQHVFTAASTKEKVLEAEVSPASSLKQNKSHHTAWRRISKCSFFCIKSSPVVLARTEKNTCASSLGKGFERGLINCAAAIVRLMAHRCTQIWIRLASMSPLHILALKLCVKSFQLNSKHTRSVHLNLSPRETRSRIWDLEMLKHLKMEK